MIDCILISGNKYIQQRDLKMESQSSNSNYLRYDSYEEGGLNQTKASDYYPTKPRYDQE